MQVPTGSLAVGAAKGPGLAASRVLRVQGEDQFHHETDKATLTPDPTCPLPSFHCGIIHTRPATLYTQRHRSKKLHVPRDT